MKMKTCHKLESSIPYIFAAWWCESISGCKYMSITLRSRQLWKIFVNFLDSLYFKVSQRLGLGFTSPTQLYFFVIALDIFNLKLQK